MVARPHRAPFVSSDPLPLSIFSRALTMPPAQQYRVVPLVPPLVLVTHEFHPHRGGIAVYAAEMARAALELGYAVEVWAPALRPGSPESVWPFPVRRLPLAGDHSLLSQWRMARQLM